MPECAKVELVAERPRGSIWHYLFCEKDFSITREGLIMNTVCFLTPDGVAYATNIEDFRPYIDGAVFSGLEEFFNNIDQEHQDEIDSLKDEIYSLKEELNESNERVDSLENELYSVDEGNLKLEYIKSRINALFNSVELGYISQDKIKESIENIMSRSEEISDSYALEMDGPCL